MWEVNKNKLLINNVERWCILRNKVEIGVQTIKNKIKWKT